jgi:hypothetical protein
MHYHRARKPCTTMERCHLEGVRELCLAEVLHKCLLSDPAVQKWNVLLQEEVEQQVGFHSVKDLEARRVS